MKRVIFACATGMSVSMFLEFVRKEIEYQNLNIIIDSIPYSQIDYFIEEMDYLVLAPQISHLYNIYKEKLSDRDIVVYQLSSKELGYMDPIPIIKKILES